MARALLNCHCQKFDLQRRQLNGREFTDFTVKTPQPLGRKMSVHVAD
jgi:hypothetical protein